METVSHCVTKQHKGKMLSVHACIAGGNTDTEVARLKASQDRNT